jgi:hypothetical protein
MKKVSFNEKLTIHEYHKNRRISNIYNHEKRSFKEYFEDNFDNCKEFFIHLYETVKFKIIYLKFKLNKNL